MLRSQYYFNSYKDYYCVFFLSYMYCHYFYYYCCWYYWYYYYQYLPAFLPDIVTDSSQQSPLYMNAYSNENGSGAGVSTGMQASAPHFNKPTTHCRKPCREGRGSCVLYTSKQDGWACHREICKPLCCR